MKRLLTALIVLTGMGLGTPSAEAGLIPWTYNAIFGYGPSFGWRSNYYAPAGYSPGYAPAPYPMTYGTSYAPYSAPYSVGYAPGFFSGYTTNYGYAAPGYAAPGCATGNCGAVNYGSYDAGCGACNSGCSPCGGGCNPCGGSPCGTSGSCSGCSADSPASPPNDPGTQTVPERNPTYAPEVEPGEDAFQKSNRSLQDPRGNNPGRNGMSVPGNSLQNDGGFSQEPIAPEFNSTRPAPAEPRGTGRTNEDMGAAPIAPVDLNAKVAFMAPAGFSRMHAEPRFRLPTNIVAARRVHHDAPATSVIASN